MDNSVPSHGTLFQINNEIELPIISEDIISIFKDAPKEENYTVTINKGKTDKLFGINPSITEFQVNCNNKKEHLNTINEIDENTMSDIGDNIENYDETISDSELNNCSDYINNSIDKPSISKKRKEGTRKRKRKNAIDCNRKKPNYGEMVIADDGSKFKFKPARGRGRAKQLESMTESAKDKEDELRKERNRCAAQQFRARKKKYIENMEKKIKDLKDKTSKQDKMIELLKERARLFKEKIELYSKLLKIEKEKSDSNDI